MLLKNVEIQIFNIDEEQYSKLITDVYNLIKLLRERAVAKNKKKVWKQTFFFYFFCYLLCKYDLIISHDWKIK